MIGRSCGLLIGIMSLIGLILIGGLIVLRITHDPYRIPTGSMLPNVLGGDQLFARRTAARFQPCQGDVIVFEFPEDREQVFIMRCVATAGDTVQVRDGILHVNGRIYESNFAARDGDHSCIPNDLEPGQCPEPHTLRSPFHYRLGLFNRSFGPQVVPPGHVFVMGDNRYDSLDSRYWGPLPIDHVRGRAAFIYWSAHEGRVRFSRLLQAVR